ncbi:Lsr2 family protein [Actinocrinis puniceicyclus]|uniref:Lsr2 family protein n=1 Tax=Actinocrinis puniceicyclus TaxID=977794 RepID=A0A8J7WKF3_9ACTN|nr:histone-like nucleoid-structuring protein Lsr2 [Actinocrinis puniceicyclus]MBS2961454.1 Lsr2 family protein [Actinocrinis puniceicyclus]
MALKRVCDITGTDRDVEICDVTIAGQTIKLDLAPAGVEKLREFFGPVITARHPTEDAGHEPEPASGETQNADESEEAESESEEPAESAEWAQPQAAPRPARHGRRPASVKSAVKGGRVKATPRRAPRPVVPGTSEIREWARANGFEIGERGAIPGRIRSAYTLAHE